MSNRLPIVVACAVLMTSVAALPARAQGDHPGRPGTIDYVEGSAAEVAVEQGRASVEVLDIQKANDIRIDVENVSTRLLDQGLYEFDASHHRILVFHGKAEVDTRDQRVKVKGEHMLPLDMGVVLKPQSFDTRQYEDDFFRWCALRSGYLSEATASAARAYVGSGPGWYGPGWHGPGWYWDSDFLSYTFLPADGIDYSPFGWSFYSPIRIYGTPYFYGFDEHGPHRFDDFHRPFGHGVERHERGFAGSGGFRGRGHR